MNKTIIFVAVGAVSLIGGIAAGLVHRSNKRYRRALEELEEVGKGLDETIEVLKELQRCQKRRDDILYGLDDDDDDDEYDFCGTNERCCAYTDRTLKEIEEGTYSE